MKITTLLENKTTCDALRCEHGLSLYIKTEKHNILFDSGASDAFWENAKALGIDLAQVDIAFLSHAHNDHCGGLLTFLRGNRTAKVYLQKEAFGDYYVVTPTKCAFIGLDPKLHEYADRFVMAEGVTKIDKELTLFSGIRTHELLSEANATLREKVGGDYPRDTFRHEQDLLVTEHGKTVLFAGCAHSGIVNIINRAEDILGRAPDYVFAGFHLYNPSLGQSEPRDLVDAVGERLRARKATRYVTGHCTGDDAYAWLHETLGDRLAYMATGTTFTI